MNPRHLERAVRVLRQGGVIAYPAEGVWGLGCDPGNREAVQRILDLKGRSADKGLILVAADIGQLQPYLVHIPVALQAEVARSWPGPVTWIVPLQGELPEWLIGSHSSVALRVSDHTQVAALCQLFGGPIVSTSANPQGCPPARSAAQVRRYFRAGIDYLLPGSLGGLQGPTAIRDALTGRVLRPG